MNNNFSSILLKWFAHNGRSLPWRETSDPYPIWLSEIILQQTRVEQGRAYWHRFMLRFPDVQTLAEASEDEVLRQWQGLGYYSRARNLHAAAREIVANGYFPHTIEGIRALKGIGDYTAAAIGSFAFDLPAAAVDGNVYRVLARHFGIDTPINTTEGKRVFQALADELLPPKQAGNFNQAMMDFGATLCTPKSPKCQVCPFIETCVAHRDNSVISLPVKLRKTQIKRRYITYIYIRCNGETAIHRRKAGDIWQGLWEPVEGSEYEMSSIINHQSSIIKPPTLLAKDVKHVLTHRILLADFYLWEITIKPELPHDYIWIPEQSIDDYAKPRLVERLLTLLPSPT